LARFAQFDGTLVGLGELAMFVFALVHAFERLRDVRQRFAAFDQSSRLSSVEHLGEYLKEILDYAEKRFEEFELDAALDRVRHVRLAAKTDLTLSALVTELRVLSETAEDQLERRHSVYIPLKKSDFYLKITDIFPLELSFVFRGIDQDITEACWCYALDRNTACVFHCMGILQHGLYSLARELDIPFGDTLDLENWKNIIDQIESKIGDLVKLKKGREKDEKLTFYSSVAMQFRYFKDAWRNHVCHLREVYDADQAHSTLIHVRDFMKQLSEPLVKGLEESIKAAIAKQKAEDKKES
jgi:hypothetical protein